MFLISYISCIDRYNIKWKKKIVEGNKQKYETWGNCWASPTSVFYYMKCENRSVVDSSLRNFTFPFLQDLFKETIKKNI